MERVLKLCCYYSLVQVRVDGLGQTNRLIMVVSVALAEDLVGQLVKVRVHLVCTL